MMTRKDFIEAARIAADTKSPKVREAITDAFCQLFRGDNPRFDEGRFREAVKRWAPPPERRHGIDATKAIATKL